MTLRRPFLYNAGVVRRTGLPLQRVGTASASLVDARGTPISHGALRTTPAIYKRTDQGRSQMSDVPRTNYALNSRLWLDGYMSGTGMFKSYLTNQPTPDGANNPVCIELTPNSNKLWWIRGPVPVVDGERVGVRFPIKLLLAPLHNVDITVVLGIKNDTGSGNAYNGSAAFTLRFKSDGTISLVSTSTNKGFLDSSPKVSIDLKIDPLADGWYDVQISHCVSFITLPPAGGLVIQWTLSGDWQGTTNYKFLLGDLLIEKGVQWPGSYIPNPTGAPMDAKDFDREGSLLYFVNVPADEDTFEWDGAYDRANEFGTPPALFDYEEIDLTTEVLDERIAFTRAEPKSHVGKDGHLRLAGPNVCPVEYDLTTARTNLIVQSVADAGGNLPPEWSMPLDPGLSTSTLGTFMENGVKFFDIAVAGTPLSDGTLRLSFGDLPVTAGVPYTQSLWVRIGAGTANGPMSIKLVTDGEGFTPPTTFTRVHETQTPGVGVTSVTPTLTVSTYTAGVSFYVVVRVGQPQFEKGSAPTDFIETLRGAVTACDPIGRSFWEARTNILLNSGDTSTSNWGGSGSTTSDYGLITVGDFTFRARRVVSAGATWHRFEHNMNNDAYTAGTSLACTLFYRAGTSGQCLAQIRNGSLATESRVRGAVGALTVESSAAGAITLTEQGQLADGTYFVKFVVVLAADAAAGQLRFGGGPNSAVAGDDIIILGGQVELAPSPSSYIQTGATQVTRDSDNAQILDLSTVRFNPDRGALYADIDRSENPPTGSSQRAVVGIDDGTSSNRIMFRRDPGGQDRLSCTVFNPSTFTAVVTPAGSWGDSGSHEAAVAWGVDTPVCVSIDGISNSTAALVPGPTGLNRMTIGSGVNSGFLNGRIKRLRYYPQGLSQNGVNAATGK